MQATIINSRAAPVRHSNPPRKRRFLVIGHLVYRPSAKQATPNMNRLASMGIVSFSWSILYRTYLTSK